MGTLDNHDFNIKKNYNNNWLDKVKKRETHCLDCKFFPVCGGACPKSWSEGNIPCPSFKFNIEDKIRIYYDLKYNKHD